MPIHRGLRVLVTLGVGAFAVALARDAPACSGAPVGPTGIALSCAHPDEDELDPDEPTPPNLRVAAQLGWTAIRHELATGGELRRRTVTASIAWRALDSLTLLGDVGALTDGDLHVRDERHVVEAGPRAGLGITWRVYGGDDWLPFIMFGASFAVLSSTTVYQEQRDRLTAVDFRSSIVIGKLFGGADPGRRIGPYLVARSVTGSLYWNYEGRSRNAQPRDLYQVGLGLSASAGSFDAFAEVCPLGERAAVVGGGFAF